MNSKILTFPLRLAVIVLIFGALFKIMHWPYAAQLMLISGVSMGLLYSIRFIKKADKSRLDYIKLSLILLWVFSYLVKAFRIFYLPYVFEFLLAILFIYWFSIEGIDYLKNRKYRKNSFLKALYFLLIALTIFALFFGILFKIQHWPYGSLLFTIGVLLLSILLLFDYLIIDRKHS
ncbi:GldL-related protein [Winogradskyella sp. 4-2091]|uniref:GldL-related protein n=1 Tax=Winogradskyella sp. 4-2091 TaxID=3381659 RepID=UPI0038926173